MARQNGQARTKKVKCPTTGEIVSIDLARKRSREIKRVQSEQRSALDASYSTSQAIRRTGELRRSNTFVPNQPPFSSTEEMTDSTLYTTPSRSAVYTTPSRSARSPKKANNNSLNQQYFAPDSSIDLDTKRKANIVPDLPSDYLDDLTGEVMNIMLEGLKVRNRTTGEISYDSEYIPIASNLFGILSGLSDDRPGCDMISAVGQRCRRGSSSTVETIELMLKMLKHRRK